MSNVDLTQSMMGLCFDLLQIQFEIRRVGHMFHSLPSTSPLNSQGCDLSSWKPLIGNVAD